jgi:hypothetical protein
MSRSSPGEGSSPYRRPLAFVLVAVLVATGVYVAANRREVSNGLGLGEAHVRMAHEAHPQTTWAPCNRNAYNGGPSTFVPLSDAAAASLVTHQTETRSYNSRSYTLFGTRYPAPNHDQPTPAQIGQLRNVKNGAGEPIVQFNPYFLYVDGRDGLTDPSTDDLIQWAAHKWGIPEDWLRAEYVHETYWDDYLLGDTVKVSAAWYARYPPQARVPDSLEVHQSLGITQIKWIPDGSLNAGSEPLRWESTAFNIDWQAAMVRFYFDNPQGSRSAWNDASYKPCQEWSSIGGWFRPYPWNNRDQAGYVRAVQQILAARTWTASSFVHWTPSSFPSGISFK